MKFFNSRFEKSAIEQKISNINEYIVNFNAEIISTLYEQNYLLKNKYQYFINFSDKNKSRWHSQAELDKILKLKLFW